MSRVRALALDSEKDVERRRATNRPLAWEITERAEDGSTLVVLSGAIDERADLDRLATSLEGRVAIDLSAVGRLSSEGVRRWMAFLGGLGKVTALALERCSIGIVTQLNMIAGFRRDAEVRSFYAPYLCRARCCSSSRRSPTRAARPPSPARGGSSSSTTSPSGTSPSSWTSSEPAAAGNIRASTPREK
jgi:hypothetical protein